MKILLLCTHATFRYGHSGEIPNAEKPFYLARSLADSGHEVTLIFGNSRLTPEMYYNVYKRLKILYLPALKNQCKTFHGHGSGKLTRTILRCGELLLQPTFVLNKSLGQTYDVVHSFWPNWPSNYVPAYLIHHLRHRSRIVIDLEDRTGGKEGIANLSSGDGFIKAISLLLFTLLENSSPRLADGAIVTTALLEKLLVRLGFPSSRIFKIPRGVDVNLFKPYDKLYSRKALGLEIRSKIITYEGGSLQLHEHCLFLLEAFKELLKHNRQVKLILLGGRVSESVRKLVKQMRMENDVLITGWLPLEKIPLYLSASDVLTLPLQENFVDASRWPNRLLEYMASGRAVVTSSVGESGKIVNNEGCGLVADPSDHRDFAEKSRHLLDNPQEAEELGMKGRVAVETKYDWSQVCKSIEGVYYKLLNLN